jgi:hypothetical protein
VTLVKKKKSSKKSSPSLKKAINNLHKSGTRFVNASLLRAHAHKKRKGVGAVYKHLSKIQKHLDNIKKNPLRR